LARLARFPLNIRGARAAKVTAMAATAAAAVSGTASRSHGFSRPGLAGATLRWSASGADVPGLHSLRVGLERVPDPVLGGHHDSSFSMRATAATARDAVDDTVPPADAQRPGDVRIGQPCVVPEHQNLPRPARQRGNSVQHGLALGASERGGLGRRCLRLVQHRQQPRPAARAARSGTC